jgi:hypothetical protein
MSEDSPTSRKTQRVAADWTWRVALALIVLVLFGRLATYDFTLWDDQGTIHRNPLLNPPTLETLRFYWTTPDQGLYVPITWTVWIAIAAVGRTGAVDDIRSTLNPWIFHGANIGLHVACTLLVFGLLRRLLPRSPAWAAFLGALVFAIHPLQVESVAWISGMKDLLCWTLFLVALRSYVDAAIRDRDVPAPSVVKSVLTRRMVGAIGLVVLAFLSKPTAMVFPAAALTIDALMIRRPWRRIAASVAPFAVLSVAFAAVARVAQTVTYVNDAPLWARPLIALDSLAFYLGKLVWPTDLLLDYGRSPGALMSTPGWWTSSFVVPPIAAVLVAFWVKYRNPTLLAAPALFVIGTLPVLGLATFQMQQYSTVTDHYVYFSMAGVGLLLTDLLSRAGRAKPVAIGATSLACAALGAVTWMHVPVWETSETLFKHVVRLRPDSWLGQNNLGSYYNDLRRYDEAEVLFRESIRVNPNNTLPYTNLAGLMLYRGDYEAARECFRNAEAAVERQPNVDATLRALMQFQIAETYLNARRWTDSLRHAERGLELAPGHPKLLDMKARAEKAIALEETRRAATQPVTTRATTRATK